MEREYKGDATMLQANGSFEMVPFRLPQAILVSKEDTDALRLLVFVHLVLCMNCRQCIAP